MRHIHQPIWIGAVARIGSPAFAILFTLDALVRATVVTVVPLLALDILGDAQRVSVLYFAVSATGLLGSLGIPWLTRQMRRRWVLSLGALCLIVSAPLLSSHTLIGLVAGLTAQYLGGTGMSICLNLYIMDHVPRQTLTRFEPFRLLFSGAAWTVAPSLGVFLRIQVANWAPYAASASFALALLGYFWFLRVTENPVVAGMTAPPPSPVYFIRRYFAQPRLALAWLLATGRAGWWGMFFIYGPIYAVTSGLGEVAGGLIVSAGSASLFAVTFWGWLGRRHGMRKLLIGGYIATGLLTCTVGFLAGVPWLGAVALVVAAVGAGSIDGAGNVPFLRAVRPRERPEMTTVYSSYRDTSRLVTPGVYSLLLQVFALPAVFTASGLTMLALGYYARYIPRRL